MAASQTDNLQLRKLDELLEESGKITLDGSTATIYSHLEQPLHTRITCASSATVPRARRSNNGILIACAAGSVTLNYKIWGRF